MERGKGKYGEIWTLPKFFSWRLDRIIKLIHHPAIICTSRDVSSYSCWCNYLHYALGYNGHTLGLAIWPCDSPSDCTLEMCCFFIFGPWHTSCFDLMKMVLPLDPPPLSLASPLIVSTAADNILWSRRLQEELGGFNQPYMGCETMGG